MKHTTKSAQETAALGQRLGQVLPKEGPVLLALQGGLGAGKTAFCGGLAKALGCTADAQSPTYAIVNLYPGPRPLAHFDLYRVENAEDLEAAGLYDYLDSGHVVAVEWPDLFLDVLPAPDYILTFQKDPANAQARYIEITAKGGAPVEAVCP